MGDDVAQRDISDAESISGDEFREPQRRPVGSNVQRNSRSRADSGVQHEGEVEPRDSRHKAARNLRMVQRSQSCRGITAFLGQESENEAEVDQRGGSPVLVMVDGVTQSICAHLIPSIGVDFPSCEKAGEDDYSRFGYLGIPQSGVAVRQ